MGPNTEFGGPRIGGKHVFETGCTIAVVFLAAASRIRPGDAIGATTTPSMSDAEGCASFRPFFALEYLTSWTTSMYSAVGRLSYRRCVAIGHLTTRGATMNCAKGCRTYCRVLALWYITSFSSTMSNTIGSSTSCCMTPLYLTAIATSMSNT